MQQPTREPSVGAKTLDREVKEYLDWVEENVPILAAREPSQVRRIIVRALNETRVARLLINLAGILIGVGSGFWLSSLLSDESSLNEVNMAAVAAGAAGATFLATRWARTLVHNRIRLLVHDT